VNAAVEPPGDTGPGTRSSRPTGTTNTTGTTDTTSPASGAVDARQAAGTLLRAGLLPAVVVDTLVVLAAIPAESEAVVGALVGTLLTVTAFATGPLLLRWARNVEPFMLFALAVATYLTVVSALGIAYSLLSDASWLHGGWVGAAILAGALAWLAGQARATAKLRILTFGDHASVG
jgi:ATP synthase protein I